MRPRIVAVGSGERLMKRSRNGVAYLLARVLVILRFNIIPVILYPLLRNNVYTARRGLAKGLKRMGGLGFIPQIIRPTAEERFLIDLDLSGETIYDVGAAYGIFTLFFAKSVRENGKVFAFEPNPRLCGYLTKNIKLNRFENVEVLQIALGKKTKREMLAFTSREFGIGSLESHEKARILSLKGAQTAEVRVDTIDHLIATGKLHRPDFVKIDVQGLELDVLVGMNVTIQEYKPKIYVEVHSIPHVDWKTENTVRILEFLSARGYSMYHVESGRMLSPADARIVNADQHLYCVRDDRSIVDTAGVDRSGCARFLSLMYASHGTYGMLSLDSTSRCKSQDFAGCYSAGILALNTEIICCCWS